MLRSLLMLVEGFHRFLRKLGAQGRAPFVSISECGRHELILRSINALTVVFVLALATQAQAQSSPAKVEQYKLGTTRMKVGAVLMAGGVFLLATTPGAGNFAAPVSIGTGMGLVMWGAKDRSDAMKPHTAFGVKLGQSRGLYFSRRW